MADSKISGLTDGAPAVGTDQIPIARAGTTKRLTLADLQALASVTSNEVSAVGATASVAINVVSNALSNEISVRAVAVDAVSNAVSVVSQALSVETAARVAAVNTVSNAASNALSVATAASNAASIVSQALSVETAARIAGVNTASNAASIVSQALSVETAARIAKDDVVSNLVSIVSQALSVETAARIAKDDVVSNLVSIVSQALSVETAARIVAVNTVSNALSDLISAHAVLSNRVSVNSAAGAGGSVTSAELVAADNAVSAQAASANTVIKGTVRILADAFTVSVASALQDVSGMSATMSSGGLYRLDGIWMSRYQSAAQVLSVGYGLTFPGMTNAVGRVAMQLSAVVGVPLGMTSNIMAHGFFDENATGSTIVQGLPGASANLTRNMMVVWEGLFMCSTTGSIQLQARTGSAGVNAPIIMPGSYMRVVRLN